jgi:hypothetical protein
LSFNSFLIVLSRIMVMYTRTFVIIASVAVVLGVAIAPIVLGTADAKITETEKCTNGGGHPKPCGTPPANIRTCTATNPTGFAPPGHNPC